MSTRPRKIYRIEIHSQNKLDPNRTQCDNFFPVDVGEIPIDNGAQWQWALENFVTNTTTSITGLLFNLVSASQPNSYSTSTKGPSFLGMATRLTQYNRYINFNSIGCPMGDTTWLRNGRAHIQLTDHNNNIYADIQWVAMICVWEVPHILV